jgi:hypothetical protein
MEAFKCRKNKGATNMNMYVRFAFITIAFLIVNTTAFTIGLTLLANNSPILSVEGFLAIGGVLLANSAAIQLLLAGKYSITHLFYIGLIPISGFFIAYYTISRTSAYQLGVVLYCISVLAGVILLFFTVKQSQNKKSLVL